MDGSGNYGAVVVSAANLDFDPPSDLVDGCTRVLCLQNEIPESANCKAALAAREAGGRVILNAAPARPSDPGLLALVDILVLNRVEAEGLTGESNPEGAARLLSSAGALEVIGYPRCGRAVARQPRRNSPSASGLPGTGRLNPRRRRHVRRFPRRGNRARSIGARRLAHRPGGSGAGMSRHRPPHEAGSTVRRCCALSKSVPVVLISRRVRRRTSETPFGHRPRRPLTRIWQSGPHLARVQPYAPFPGPRRQRLQCRSLLRFEQSPAVHAPVLHRPVVEIVEPGPDGSVHRVDA